MVGHLFFARRANIPLQTFFGRAKGQEVVACLPQMHPVRSSRSLWRQLTVDFCGIIVLPAAHWAHFIASTGFDGVIATTRALTQLLHVYLPKSSYLRFLLLVLQLV